MPVRTAAKDNSEEVRIAVGPSEGVAEANSPESRTKNNKPAKQPSAKQHRNGFNSTNPMPHEAGRLITTSTKI